MDAAVAPASSTYDALCQEFSAETSALCGALASETPASLVDHMAIIFPAEELSPLIDELTCALQKTPPRPAFLEAMRDELSASSGDSAATTTDGAKFDEASQCAQEHVRVLSKAHFVDSAALGIPKAEQDADGELLLGTCKCCKATRLLSSLAEHEASCRPEALIRQPAPSATAAPAASEGLPSGSQGGFAPKKTPQQKSARGRPQKRPRVETAPPGPGVDPLCGLPNSSVPWAAQPPAKRLPPLYPGTAAGSAPHNSAEGTVQDPTLPVPSVPAPRLKPIVRVKQASAAVKTSSPAAALNAAWANFPMPGDFMAEDLGSFPQSMDWLNSAELAVPQTAAAPSAEGAAAKAAAKAEAKANAKAAATAAQNAAAKKAAKRRRALAAAPNRRLGLFGAFTLHPRKKRSTSFKRKPRASLKAPAQQPGAFAEVIASLPGDSPPQQQRHAQKPRPRAAASLQGANGPSPRMRHPAANAHAHAHASLNALSANPSLSVSQPAPERVERAISTPATPAQPAQAGPPGRQQQPSLSSKVSGELRAFQQYLMTHIPQELVQRARAEGNKNCVKLWFRQQSLMFLQRQQQHMQAHGVQQHASAGSPRQTALSQAEAPGGSSGSPGSLMYGSRAPAQQQLPPSAGIMIPISSQAQTQHLSGPNLRYGMIPVSQGAQTPGGPAHLQKPQQQHLSMQQQEALRATYLQRAGQPSQATSIGQAYQPTQAPGNPVGQAGSANRRPAMQQPYSGMPVPVQASNPMATVTSSQSYRQPSQQQGPYGSSPAASGYPHNGAMSGPQYAQTAPSMSRARVSQGQAGQVPAHAGQPVVSFGQQQYAAAQPQRYRQQQQQVASPQHFQWQAAQPMYLADGHAGLRLPNGINPLKGSHLGALPPPEPNAAMRWIPTSLVTPPTDKLASVQQLNAIPGARPEDAAQPLLGGQYKFQY